MPWWMDWPLFLALCALCLAIWWAVRPRHDAYDDSDPVECRYYDGGPRPKVSLVAGVERDENFNLICTRCKASAYSAEICADPECPTTLMMKRLGISEDGK